MSSHIANKSNPHNVTKEQIGLGKVDNTSDADKPVSTATQDALDLKANINSPEFTGIPRIMDAPEAEDSSSRIPTTAWVVQKIKESYPVSPTSYWLKLENN